MFSASRTLLVIFLALLQFVAPLVHAHAGGKFFAAAGHEAGKLHVPGLEVYQGSYDRLIPDTGGLQYSAAKLVASADGLVVGVDTGIKQNQHSDAVDVDHYFLPQAAIVFNAALAFKDNASPRSPPRLWPGYLFSPHSPRAPPAH
ncbi:MAG: hypothetical protein Q7U57_15675 [Methylovulum sp.]|nr:hypothetical protein [Methylovulum sp.]